MVQLRDQLQLQIQVQQQAMLTYTTGDNVLGTYLIAELKLDNLSVHTGGTLITGQTMPQLMVIQ
ncbi:Uncharacterised protein [Staphylococcus gallinarum]|uniref:Uncharacterized protein n=1 Tax=Staphylococcus gallinarum TaxID=1293 RepID=A0A380FF58_STAGA|nr:Uncharacterised protein [Staphylococcus gallinarum]